MKILWFTNTPSLYKKNEKGYNGGGWIESLENIITKENDIELAVGFFHADTNFKKKKGKTTYYPIPLYNTIVKKLKRYFFYNNDKNEVNYYLKVINDFKPDIIHVFGSEQSFGLLSLYTKIPVVIHVQGILNPYLNAYYAPGSNMLDLIKQNLFKPLKIFNLIRGMSIFKFNAQREAIILKNCKYYMGRTEWDKNVTSLYAPESRYFYCSEVLRDSFYDAKAWQQKKRTKLILVSTISKTSYKGFDLIIKTAKILQELNKTDFEWNVFGIKEYNEWEAKLGIKCSNVNVFLKGVADSSTLVKNIQESDIFIHPSYIDNSPNSLCEAQVIGIPVISTNVGGITSLIKNEETGLLIPANDPYTLAARIIEIKNNKLKAIKIGDNARSKAKLRHDKEIILNDLLDAYKQIKNAKITNKNI
ncbi:glycosyltransferase family 4 protein [Arenibacter algicola]|uniref:glycosyltransferase family 4 protein n=1 Tax=Arenibacter algicola TaxID=616991 RepID=UPI0004DF6527|nr:glycosyltransferase family 4 protein [Arenibacter algicola]